MISYNKALEIFKKTKINIKTEIVSSKYAVNRISAINIISPDNYPAANNTAFDGFAIIKTIVAVIIAAGTIQMDFINEFESAV